MFKKHVQNKLEKLVRKYFRKHHPKLIVVVGGAGKTTTKTAIATVLATKYRIQMEDSNHNTWLSVPPAIMGVRYPDKVHSIRAWRRVFKAMRIRIKSPTGVDMIVQELGTDRPGEIPHFGTYLKPDIVVVTAVVPEHMENFADMNAVAAEELSAAGFSDLTIVNRDDVSEEYAKYADTTNISTYGVNSDAEYWFEITSGSPLEGYRGNLMTPEFGSTPTVINLVGEHNLRAGIAAGMIGAKLGMSAAEIAAALPQIQPVSGRMNVLRGFRGTTIIDDTYNSTPKAAEEALRTLYQIETSQRIAILGSMNELGEMTSYAHGEIGRMCDPSLLDWVITIGADADRYLAPAAKTRGNNVASFASPQEAGAFANKVMNPGAVVLVKGSQNGVFAEEAVKILLAHIDDEQKLVRQSPAWMKIKQDLFEVKFYSEVEEPKNSRKEP